MKYSDEYPKSNLVRNRRSPASELYRLFLKPIMDMRPPTSTPREWLRKVLLVSQRPIVEYSVKQKCRIPGHWVTDIGPLPSWGDRVVEPGEILWVRKDEFKMRQVEVEVNSTGCWYRMSNSDWAEHVRPFVEIIE